jgi:hypothetical protein
LNARIGNNKRRLLRTIFDQRIFLKIAQRLSALTHHSGPFAVLSLNCLFSLAIVWERRRIIMAVPTDFDWKRLGKLRQAAVPNLAGKGDHSNDAEAAANNATPLTNPDTIQTASPSNVQTHQNDNQPADGNGVAHSEPAQSANTAGISDETEEEWFPGLKPVDEDRKAWKEGLREIDEFYPSAPGSPGSVGQRTVGDGNDEKEVKGMDQAEGEEGGNSGDVMEGLEQAGGGQEVEVGDEDGMEGVERTSR